MSYTSSTCYTMLHNAGLTCCDTPTNQDTCSSWKALNQEIVHMVCGGTDPYLPIQAIVCRNSSSGQELAFSKDDIIPKCSALIQQDPNWNFYQCYCCCVDSYAANISIAHATGSNKVHELLEGNAILAGSLDGSGVSWLPAILNFSTAIQSAGAEEMLFLNFGDNQKMTCTPDH
ncbi:MAG: hypothetical protein ACRCYO_17255, partial [Bacteroidia bacterium]